jgi:hypothetical protein
MVDMRRNQWLVVAVAAMVGVILGGAAAVTWQHVRPRLPTLAAATATLDQAIALAVAGAGDSAAVTVSGLVPSLSCQKTFLAKGSRYVRTANLFTDPGREDAVIDRIASALPANEHAVRSTRTPVGGSSLSADLGDGIHLQVLPIGAGWLAATAKTDCRTGDQPQPTATPDATAGTGPVTQLLTELGATPAGFHTDTVACPSGRIITLDAISQPTTTDNLPSRLAAFVPPGARQFSSPSNRVAWRDHNTSTIVASSDDGTQITVQRTITC